MRFEEKLVIDFFKNGREKELFQNLRHHAGKIVGKEGRGHEDFFDSILPKKVGGASELLVCAYLTRKNYGYVVSLLQAQRLLENRGYIIPPDFLFA